MPELNQQVIVRIRIIFLVILLMILLNHRYVDDVVGQELIAVWPFGINWLGLRRIVEQITPAWSFNNEGDMGATLYCG